MEKIDTSKLGPIKIDLDSDEALLKRALNVSHAFRTPMEAIAGILRATDRRVRQLIIGNSEQVIKRREATAILRKNLELFSKYGREHRAKQERFIEACDMENADASAAKAQTNELAAMEIQTFLDNLHVHGPSPMGKAQ